MFFERRWKNLLIGAMVGASCLAGAPASGAETPHGLQPAADMPYIPDLGGLRARTFKNQYGQVRHLAESVVVRQSKVEGGKAHVPAGGLFYISETKEDAAPFMRDPFFVLGEHAYLVDLKSHKNVVRDVKVAKREKVLVDKAGYRLWFDYATDHYDKPYIQLALIAPSGHWPLEFPVSSKFPPMEDIRDLEFKDGLNPQLIEYYLDPDYWYGASKFTVKDHDFDQAVFDALEYPVIDEATFSLSRPWVLDVRQEDFRWYGTKRIYAFRRPDGFLVRVTDFSGDKVLGEKLIRPLTPQGYKDRNDVKEEYFLSLPEENMRVEIMVQPEYLKHSDFTPWSTDVPFGWTDGLLSFVIYDDLITVKNGEAWPLDSRYTVGLEANLLTGKLKRLILENAEAFTLDNSNNSFDGPVKYSEVWNRPAFKLVAKGFSDKSVSEYYVRDAFFQRTDNMVFNRNKGRKDVDLFVGRAPTLIPILEDSFLTRLSDKTYGIVVQGSHFTTHPQAMDNMAFNAPDPTAPFGGLLRGFNRTNVKNRKGDALVSAEGLVIRGSYVDWCNNRIVIPRSGLFYTSRNGRNVRALRGESFYMLGKKAWIGTFQSATFVQKNVDVDFWKLQPEGSLHPVFWQDLPLGENNKVLRYTEHKLLDDRPMGLVNVVKYSGNNFGAPFLLAQNLDPSDPETRYNVHPMFGEGSTWIIPEFVGDNYMRIKEFGTPLIQNIQYTYTEPKRVLLGEGESARLGDGTVKVIGMDEAAGTVTVEIADKDGKAETKVLGPLNEQARNLLPQHQDIVNRLQLVAGPLNDRVMAEMDIEKPFEGGKAALWTYVDLLYLENEKPLPTDSRFMVRSDVCGHCYQLNELLFDNSEEIVLDRHNPRYDGPRGADGNPIFSIVVDSFDGEMIHAWHIETVVRGRVFKSDNLAFNPRNNVDVLMGVNGTTEGFLRANMLERSAYQEYWRTGLHEHAKRGLDAWMAHKFQ